MSKKFNVLLISDLPVTLRLEVGSANGTTSMKGPSSLTNSAATPLESPDASSIFISHSKEVVNYSAMLSPNDKELTVRSPVNSYYLVKKSQMPTARLVVIFQNFNPVKSVPILLSTAFQGKEGNPYFANRSELWWDHMVLQRKRIIVIRCHSELNQSSAEFVKEITSTLQKLMEENSTQYKAMQSTINNILGILRQAEEPIFSPAIEGPFQATPRKLDDWPSDGESDEQKEDHNTPKSSVVPLDIQAEIHGGFLKQVLNNDSIKKKVSYVGTYLLEQLFIDRSHLIRNKLEASIHTLYLIGEWFVTNNKPTIHPPFEAYWETIVLDSHVEYESLFWTLMKSKTITQNLLQDFKRTWMSNYWYIKITIGEISWLVEKWNTSRDVVLSVLTPKYPKTTPTSNISTREYCIFDLLGHSIVFDDEYNFLEQSGKNAPYELSDKLIGFLNMLKFENARSEGYQSAIKKLVEKAYLNFKMEQFRDFTKSLLKFICETPPLLDNRTKDSIAMYYVEEFSTYTSIKQLESAWSEICQLLKKSFGEWLPKRILDKMLQGLPLDSENEKDATMLQFVLTRKEMDQKQTKINTAKKYLLGAASNKQSAYYRLLEELFSDKPPFVMDENVELEISLPVFIDSIKEFSDGYFGLSHTWESPIDLVTNYSIRETTCFSTICELVFTYLTLLGTKATEAGYDRYYLTESMFQSVPVLAVSRQLMSYVDGLSSKNLSMNDISQFNRVMTNGNFHIELFCKEPNEIISNLENLRNQFDKSVREIKDYQAFIQKNKQHLEGKLFDSDRIKQLEDLQEKLEKTSISKIANQTKDIGVYYDEKAASIFSSLCIFSYFKTQLKAQEDQNTEQFFDRVVEIRDQWSDTLSKVARDEIQLSIEEFTTLLPSESENSEEPTSIASLIKILGLNKHEAQLIEMYRKLLVLKKLIRLFKDDSFNKLFAWKSFEGKSSCSKIFMSLNSLSAKLKQASPEYSEDKLKTEHLGYLNDIDLVKFIYLNPDLVEVIAKNDQLIQFLFENQGERDPIKKFSDEIEDTYTKKAKKMKNVRAKLNVLINSQQVTGDQIIEHILSIGHDSILISDLKALKDDIRSIIMENDILQGNFKNIAATIMTNSVIIIQYNSDKDEFETVAQSQIKDDSKPTCADEWIQLLQRDKYYSAHDLNDYFSKASIQSQQKLTKDEEKDMKNVIEMGILDHAIRRLHESLKKLTDIGIVCKSFDREFILELQAQTEARNNGRVGGGKLVQEDQESDEEHNGPLIFLISPGWEDDMDKINKYLEVRAKNLAEQFHSIFTTKDSQRANKLLTYFTGQRMYYLLKMFKLPIDKRKAKLKNILPVLEQANDGLKFKEDCFDTIQYIQDHEKNDLILNVADRLKCITFKASSGSPEFISSNKVSFINLKHLNQSSNSLKDDSKLPVNFLNVWDLLLKMFCSHKTQKLMLTDIFECSLTTNQLEIDAFLARCFFDKQKRVYIVKNIKDLQKKMLEHLLAEVTRISIDADNRKLLIINDLELANEFADRSIYQNIDIRCDSNFLRDIVNNSYTDLYEGKLRSVKIVKSELAGEGKTFWIKNNHAARVDKKLTSTMIEMSFSGETSKKTIHEQLLNISKMVDRHKSKQASSKFDLHIKIDYIEGLELVGSLIDSVLFSLCFFQMHYIEGGICSYEDDIAMIYIEIGNSCKNMLEKSLLTIQVLEGWDEQAQLNTDKMTQLNIVTKIETFKSSNIKFVNECKSDEQVVARYLQEAENAEFSIKSIQKQTSIPVESYKRLMDKYFKPIDSKKRTFSNYVFWVKSLAKLKRDLDKWIEQPKDLMNLDLSTHYIETSLLILSTANSLVELQDNGAAKCQDFIIEMLDKQKEDGDNSISASRREELSKLINSVRWDTSNLYLPIISRNYFLPVASSAKQFLSTEALVKRYLEKHEANSTRTKNMTSDDQIFAIKNFFSTKRLNVSLANLFDKIRTHNIPSELFYTFLLAHLRLDHTVNNIDTISKYEQNIRKQFQELYKISQEFVPKASKSQADTLPEIESRKGFSITEDVYLKIALMHFKASIKAPIIIMGESGCGKTYVTNFIVHSLTNGDTLLMQTLYSGYPEKRLIVFILDTIRKAQLLTNGKNLWVFFDEFNTTALQSIIADLMLDRVCPKVETITKIELEDSVRQLEIEAMSIEQARSLSELGVPENMLFVGCCNPFSVRLKTNDTDIGLIPNEKSSIMSHIVHPIPKRLLGHLWDFGQLSDKDEKEHIKRQIYCQQFYATNKTEKLPASTPITSKQVAYENQRKADFALLLFNCHKIVRDIEERSGVSLRDLNRAYLFYKWFNGQLKNIKNHYQTTNTKEQPWRWMLESSNIMDVASAICTMMICYGVRLNGQTQNQDTLLQYIYEWVKYSVKMKLFEITVDQIRFALCDLAKAYLENCKTEVSTDIALNTPLLENFMVSLSCYAVGVPLLIIGAPGTSKTLSNTLLHRLLKDCKFELLKGFNVAKYINYTGSQSSTPEAVERIFIKAEENYKTICKDESTKPNDKKTSLMIFFDELGLAETSPHNPLKVMHAYLEKNLNRIMFTGISNWKPDQSKQNRMICLTRPDIQREDIEQIFEKVLRDQKDTVAKAFKPILQSVATRYLDFRTWQKAITKCNKTKIYHSHFHGSRDVYATLSSVIKTLQKSSSKLSSNPAKAQEIALDIVLTSISRNFNGEIYVIGDEENDLKLDHLKLPYNGDQANDNKKQFMSDGYFEEVLNKGFRESKKIHRRDDLEAIYNSNDLDSNSSTAKDFSFCLTSSEVFKMFLFETLQVSQKLTFDTIRTKINDPPIFESIEESFNDSKSRFLMVRTESYIIEDILIQKIREMMIAAGKDVEKLIDMRTSFDDGNNDKLLPAIKAFIADGYTIILKNQDILYGALYELFNQKYTKDGDEYLCNLYYGQARHTVSVEVHKDFKCVVILPSSLTVRRSKDLEKRQQAPFLNRFEKQYLHLGCVLDKKQMEDTINTKKRAVELSSGKFVYMPCLTMDLVTSVQYRSTNSKKEYSDKFISAKLLQLSTANNAFSNLASHDLKLLSRINDPILKIVEDVQNGKLKRLDSVENGQFVNKICTKLMLLTFCKLDLSKLTGIDKIVKASQVDWKDIQLQTKFIETYFGNGIVGDAVNCVLVFETADGVSKHLYKARHMFDRFSKSFKSCVFLVQMPTSSSEWEILKESNGISFWNDWDVRVQESIDQGVSYSELIDARDRPLLDTVLKSNSQISFQVITDIIISIWSKVVPYDKVDTDVSKLQWLLHNCKANNLFMENMIDCLKGHIKHFCAPNAHVTVKESVERDSTSDTTYRHPISLLTVAVISFFNEKNEIIRFFSKFNRLCSNFYTRLLGIDTMSREVIEMNVKIINDSLQSLEKDYIQIEDDEQADRCYYSPLTQEDVTALKQVNLDEIYRNNHLYMEEENVKFVAQACLKAVKLTEDQKYKLSAYENFVKNTYKELFKSLKSQAAEGSNLQELLNQAQKDSAVADVLTIDILRLVVCDDVFDDSLSYDNLRDFLCLCNGLKSSEFQGSDHLQSSLIIPLQLCLHFKDVVKGLINLLKKGKQGKEIKKKLNCWTDEKEKSSLIRFKWLDKINQYVRATEYVEFLKGTNNAAKIAEAEKNINLVEIFGESSKRYVGLLLKMIKQLSTELVQLYISKLYNISDKYIEDERVLPTLYNLGYKVLEDFLISISTSGRLTEQDFQSVRLFVRMWTSHDSKVNFACLATKRFELIFDNSIFNLEKSLLIVFSAFQAFPIALPKIDSPDAILSILDLVSKSGDKSTRFENLIATTQDLVGCFNRINGNNGKYLMKLLHDYLIYVGDECEHGSGQKLHYSLKAMTESIKTLLACNLRTFSLKLVFASACFWLCLRDPQHQFQSDPKELSNVYSIFMNHFNGCTVSEIIEHQHGEVFLAFFQESMPHDTLGLETGWIYTFKEQFDQINLASSKLFNRKGPNQDATLFQWLIPTFKTFDMDELMSQFNSQMSDARFVSNTPTLAKVYELRKLLRIYDKLMGRFLDINRHLQITYSGKMSSSESKRPLELACRSDEPLQDLYRELKKVLSEIDLEIIKICDKYIFNNTESFSFKDYIKKLQDSKQVAMHDFIVDAGQKLNAEIFLNCLTNKVHNELMQTIFNGEKDNDKVEDNFAATDISQAFIKDFVSLDEHNKELNWNSLVVKNSTFDPRFGELDQQYAYIIDFESIQQILIKNTLPKLKIRCEKHAMNRFELSAILSTKRELQLERIKKHWFGRNKNVIEKFATIIDLERLGEDLYEKLRKSFRLCNELVDYFLVDADLNDQQDKQEFLEALINTILAKNDSNLKEQTNNILFADMMVGDLPEVIDYLKDQLLKATIDEKYHTKLSEEINNFIKKERRNRDLKDDLQIIIGEMKKLIESSLSRDDDYVPHFEWNFEGRPLKCFTKEQMKSIKLQHYQKLEEAIKIIRPGE